MLEDRRSWRKRYPTSQAAVPTSFFRYPDRWMLSEQQDQCAYSGIHLTLIIQSTVALRGQVCHRNAQAHSAAKQSLRVLVCKTQHYLDFATVQKMCSSLVALGAGSLVRESSPECASLPAP